MYARGEHREIYHIGAPNEVTIKHLVELITQSVDANITIITGPAPVGQTSRRCPDISKMRQLGYEPSVSLTDGLARTLEWYRDRQGELRENVLL